MKILITGPSHLKTVPMGKFSVDALVKMGHRADYFPLSSGVWDKVIEKLLRKKKHSRANKKLIKKVSVMRPDFVLNIFGFDLEPKTQDYFKLIGIPSVCWWLNDPFQFARSLSKAKCYDIIFTNSMVSAIDYRNNGVNNAYWLPTACDPQVHHKVEPINQYVCDICFAGDWSPLREQWCDLLAKHFDLKVFGPWKSKVQKDSPLQKIIVDGFFDANEMAAMFSSSKIVFNLHAWYGKWDHGTNPRLFEAAGCGVCQVVDWKQDIEHLFVVGEELIVFRSKNELIDLVGNLLADDNKRYKISKRVMNRAVSEHTYTNRMNTIIDQLKALDMVSSK